MTHGGASSDNEDAGVVSPLPRGLHGIAEPTERMLRRTFLGRMVKAVGATVASAMVYDVVRANPALATGPCPNPSGGTSCSPPGGVYCPSSNCTGTNGKCSNGYSVDTSHGYSDGFWCTKKWYVTSYSVWLHCWDCKYKTSTGATKYCGCRYTHFV